MERLPLLLFLTRRATDSYPVRDSNGQAKFWIEPEVALEKNYGLKEDEIIDVLSIITKRKKEIIDAWHKHFTD
jgi:hypothetical protein